MQKRYNRFYVTFEGISDMDKAMSMNFHQFTDERHSTQSPQSCGVH